jgi:hypothetical protein
MNLSLSTDVLVAHIFSYCTPQTLLELSLCSTAYNSIIHENSETTAVIWRTVYQQYTNNYENASSNIIDWKQLCKDGLKFYWSDLTKNTRRDQRITHSNNNRTVHYDKSRHEFNSATEWITLFSEKKLTAGNRYKWHIRLDRYSPDEDPVNYYTIIPGIVSTETTLKTTCEYAVGKSKYEFGLQLGTGSIFTNGNQTKLIEIGSNGNTVLTKESAFNVGEIIGFDFEFNSGRTESILTVYRDGKRVGELLRQVLPEIEYNIGCSMIADQKVTIGAGIN